MLRPRCPAWRLPLSVLGKILFIGCCGLLASMNAAAFADQDDADSIPAADAPISFREHIVPIFRTHCYGCHQGAKQQGAYVMTAFDTLLSGGESGQEAIVPGDPEASYLMSQIIPTDGRAEMPKGDLPPLSATEIEQVRTWIASGAVNDTVETEVVYSNDSPPVYHRPPVLTAVAVAPDNQLIAVSGFHEVLLLDAASGQVDGRLIGLSPRIDSLAFSPDGSRLAVAGGAPSQRGELQIWDVNSRQLEMSLPVTYDTITGVSWSPDGKQVAFACADTTIRAVDAETGQQVLYQSAHEDWVRDTVYSVDGSHLVSVGRDMTVKLTEVATERFIDNITSITPGALSGGVNSVARHPDRDELLVGGADGVPKLYRMFRQTARKIGDDANLVLRLPALPGRIFSVDISPDGSLLAAAATVDRASEVRVWKYDVDGEMPAEIKRIQGKRVSDRSAAEKQKLQEYVTKEVSQVAQVKLPEGAVFSIAFAPDNRLIVAGGDGNLRVLPAGEDQFQTVWPVAPAAEQTTATTEAMASFDPRSWAAVQAGKLGSPGETEAANTAIDRNTLTGLQVEPEEIHLRGRFDYTQLLVTGTLDADAAVDMTNQCELELPDFLVAEPGGLLRPIQDGAGEIIIRCGQQQASIPVTAVDVQAERTIDFIRDVNPALSRLGCNQGTCHGAQAGKNGFKLSLRGYDPIFDLRALSDDLAGRRLTSVSPDDSLMLLKPLGMVPHEGGVLMTADDPYHAILRGWIASGAHLDLATPRVQRIEVLPHNPTVQTVGQRQQIRVVAHYQDGLQRDVTREAFIESGNGEVAVADRHGVVTTLRRGEAPVLARYEGAYATTTLTVMGDRDGFVWQQPETWGRIDELVAEKWRRLKLLPSELASDEAFLRRVTLDLTGLLPTATEVREFLDDDRPTQQKRDEVLSRLSGNDAFVDYWTNKWADLLQVNRKFLGVEGAREFRQWIESAVQENRPYDQFAREILTATGSNREHPAASYYKILRDPETTVENTTHLFLGIRFNCNKCHDHPFERWTQDQYYETAAYFAQVALKPDPESKDRKIAGSAVEGAKPLFEEVYDRPSGQVLHERTGLPVEAAFPYEAEFEASEDATLREQLALWMTSADNQYFARSYVNRIWGYLTGVGLIEPIDDIRAGNPSSNPELLDYLTERFIESGFDTRSLMHEICSSRTYQLSVVPNQWNADDVSNYARATPRRLSAEVLFDAVHALTGATSQIPGVPAGTRAASLPDAGVELADGFLANLGRPPRESACECERSSELQLGPVMALVSGPTVGTAIASEKNLLRDLVAQHEEDRRLVEEIFVRALARFPTDAEFAACQEVFAQIPEDHETLVQTVAQREQWWQGERQRLEKERRERLAERQQQLSDLVEQLRPETERLTKERDERIAAAQQALEQTQASLPERIAKYVADHRGSVAWYPLQPVALATTNKATLRSQPDRSIVASENADKGAYEVKVHSTLSGITGFRLEALPVEGLTGGGPGLPNNGNFVVTEFQITAAPIDAPEKAVPVKLKKAEANFSQSNFAPGQMINGKTNDQGGWAVSPHGGIVHWATFQTDQPLDFEKGVVLTFTLHQNHNAADHRLARFRISATTHVGDLPLSIPEAFASVQSNDADFQADPLLMAYFQKMDEALLQKQEALTVAKRPVPENEGVTSLKRQIQALEVETTDDSRLVQLRKDLQQSEQQQQQLRLTAAEDLTWALINSPAFLFNH